MSSTDSSKAGFYNRRKDSQQQHLNETKLLFRYLFMNKFAHETYVRDSKHSLHIFSKTFYFATDSSTCLILIEIINFTPGPTTLDDLDD